MVFLTPLRRTLTPFANLNVLVGSEQRHAGCKNGCNKILQLLTVVSANMLSNAMVVCVSIQDTIPTTRYYCSVSFGC